MTSLTTLAKYTFGDMIAEFMLNATSQSVGLRLYPAEMANQALPHREFMNDKGWSAWNFEPLVQFKLLGDSMDGFAQGHTMRNSSTLASLKLADHQVAATADRTEVVTYLASPRGYSCEHHLIWQGGERALQVMTVFQNTSDQPLTLEMLSSFSISGLTPFAVDDAPERLYVHRFQSAWSAEGRHESRLAEEANLEPSWTHHGVRVERFGQVGSMPVRGFFPWAGVEDRAAGVMWGASLAIPGSWQMEFYRRDDFLCLSGGLADREFGHWMKTVAPGETFASPVAYLSTVKGCLDDLCARLVSIQLPAAEGAPASEKDLPVICNEYCSSWGNPHHADLVAMADRLKDTGVKYLVIDAGWYKAEDGSWDQAQGEWIPSHTLFPYGLAATAQAIRQRGLIPGIWFEFEVVNANSTLSSQSTDHVLKRDGLPVVAGGRRFWDFRDPWVIQRLSQRVIDQLRECDFGYIKVDYNETIGIGCDEAGGSPGEGLRQHLAGVQSFFRKMRTELPELVIENCSSGGHRLEPSMMALASMGSFSDAHESPEIPVIAANLQRMIQPRQSQIWAVLHSTDNLQRLAYSLSAGFLGRLCLSGDIASLSTEQWDLVKEAVSFNSLVAPVIARGSSHLYQQISPSWRHLKGAQAVFRLAEDGQSALLVVHSFASPLPELAFPLPGRGWQISATYPHASTQVECSDSELRCVFSKEWEGTALYLTKS